MTKYSPESRLLVLLCLAGLGAAACGGDDLVLPSEGEPANISLVLGDGQSGRVGEMLAQPLVAQVTDVTGRPVVDANVIFELPGSQPDTAATDGEGRASGRLALGTTVGPATGAARVIVPEAQAPVETSFSVTALPSSANGLSMVSGDGQSAPVNTPLPQPLVVKVADGFGNPVAGVEVHWTALGGGSVSEQSSITDAQGLSSVVRTLGSAAGAQTTDASAEGLAGSPVVFSHTASAGSAAGVRIASGNEQTAAVGAQLPADFVIEVLDAGSNPVAGAPVVWTVTGGGGSVSQGSNTTDAAGRAATRLTLGTLPGTNTVQASVSGVGSVTFTATATTGAPAALTVRTQPSTNAVVGVRFGRQPEIQLVDGAGNDVKQGGVTVLVTVLTGNGQLLGNNSTNTDGNGRASFTDLAIGGATGTHTLIFAAPGFTSATSTSIEVTRASTTTQITSHLPDPSAVGQAVTVQFSVSSNAGTPTGTVQVTVSGGGETCSADASAGSCTITLTTAGSRTLTASYAGNSSFEPSSDTDSHEVQSPNSPPTAQDDGFSTPAGQQLSVGAPGVLGNDSDPDGGTLSAQLATNPANGSVALQSDGSFSYTPNPGFLGEDSFSYQVTDGQASATATVRIAVQ